MGDDKAKAAGGAVLGAGGILALILKSTSAEVHAVEAGGQAMRGAGQLAHAGELGAAARGAAPLTHAAEIGGRSAGLFFRAGEQGTGRLVMAGAEIELASLKPLGPVLHPATQTATVAKGAAAPAAKITKASRLAELGDAVENASDAKDVVDAVSTAWDLLPDADQDDKDRIHAKLTTYGLDFDTDVTPALKKESLTEIPNATRMLLTDGHAVIPALHVPDDAKTRPLTDREKQAMAAYRELPGSDWAMYLEVPGVDSVTRAHDLVSTLLQARSQKIEWVELETAHVTSPKGWPPILEQADRQFVRIDGKAAADAGGVVSHVLLLRKR